jgi:RNA-directed DNA polymerase
MKRANNLLSEILDPDNMRLASWKAAKGKRHAKPIRAWQSNLNANLLALRAQISAGNVEVGRYHFFTIFDPKERLICAPSFGEQVLHHSLMNVCHTVFERALIYDTYASRKGKGTYAALHRASSFSSAYAWYLKLDIRKFFETIHHATLKRQLYRLFKEERLLKIMYDIIDSYSMQPGRGVPIGSLTSQYFANHYLSGLDHFIKENLGIRAYVRYMDDMVLWHDDKRALLAAYQEIEKYVVDKLECTLKPIVCNKTERGLTFLGYRVFRDHTRLSQRSKVRFVRNMHLVVDNYQSGHWHEKGCQRRVQPLLGFVCHAHTRPRLKGAILSIVE